MSKAVGVNKNSRVLDPCCGSGAFIVRAMTDAILHMLLTDPKCAGYDLSGWKVVVGGAALPGALCDTALDRGIDVFAGYGIEDRKSVV